MFIVKKEKDEVFSLSAKELSFEQVGSASSLLAQKILHSLMEEPKYPADIAKGLKVHEQKVYYHIRNLEKAGIIEVVKKEAKKGATANFYKLTEPAFFVKLKKLEHTQKIAQIKGESTYLEPFIINGKLDALIVVGSPDPHGPDKARSRDGYYGIDLALFLGTFLNYVPEFKVKLDTEIKDSELSNNLILIGGPITNKTTDHFNQQLPVRFENGNVYSLITKRTYPEDEIGLVVKIPNPLNKDKSILVVAGKRFSGTKAAIIAFLKHFKRIQEGNSTNKKIMASVVEGIDLDSDGIIDDVEFRE